MASRLLLPVLSFVLAVAITIPAAHAQTLRENLWITNGPVHAIAATENTIYIGGSFYHVGRATGRSIFSAGLRDGAPLRTAGLSS